MPIDNTVELYWTVDDVLTPAECAQLIDRIEFLGPTNAPITTSAGFVMRPDIRNNTRVMFDDPTLAAELLSRVRDHVPLRFLGRTLAGANERFRCYKYEPGQRFAAHYDGPFRRDDREQSFLTYLVFLNDDFTGGETTFLDLRECVQPKRGRALLFQHRQLHEGSEVLSGVKYVLRTDIMYRSE